MDNVLFDFPGITLLLPSRSDPIVGTLKLAKHDIVYRDGGLDTFLRLLFIASSGVPEVDTVLRAENRSSKLDSEAFIIHPWDGPEVPEGTEGPKETMTIFFPPVNTLIPQNDPAIDIPKPLLEKTTWQDVIDTFEVQLGRWTRLTTHPATTTAKSSEYPIDKKGQITKYNDGGFSSGMQGPMSSSSHSYDPSRFANEKDEGRLVLVDEENGGEVGEISGYQVQTIGVQPGSKDPVEITLPQNGEGPVMVRTAEYLNDSLHPAYANSTIVSTAATASRLIVTTSSYIANAIQQGADAYTKRTKPAVTPMTFAPSTHDRVRQIHTFSSNAAKISAQTIGQVSKHAQNLGAKFAGKTQDRPSRGEIANPGLFNKSLIAFSTIADGIDYASKSLLASGSNAATTVVGHKYGEEARSVAYGLTGSAKNVGLVYVDASGVSRRAIVKGVAKGMVIGKVRGGGQVVVPGWDDIPQGGVGNTGPQSYPGSGKNTPDIIGNEVGFGNSAPPSYGSFQGTPAGNVNGQGVNTYFPPPPSNMISPQGTGTQSYGNMRSVSPRPYDPSSMSSEKGPVNGGYRY